MPDLALEELVGRRLRLPGHFAGVVTLENARRMDGAYELRVRTEEGRIEPDFLADSELDAVELVEEELELVDGNDFFDMVEARRIELASRRSPIRRPSPSTARCRWVAASSSIAAG